MTYPSPAEAAPPISGQDVVRLATEAEEIRERLARKEDDPAARLAEIERVLVADQEAKSRAREQAQAEFERVLSEYLPAEREADEATRALVSAVTHAVELRRQLEAARKRAGTSAPPKASVRASRDRELRQLRQDARLAAGSDY